MGIKIVQVRVKCKNHSIGELESLCYLKWTAFIYKYEGDFNIEHLETELRNEFKRSTCKDCNEEEFNELEYSLSYIGKLKL